MFFYNLPKFATSTFKARKKRNHLKLFISVVLFVLFFTFVQFFLFEALLKTKLIEDRPSSNYSRCGRTDKGVSAFGQVITLDVRSNLREGLGVIQKENSTNEPGKG